MLFLLGKQLTLEGSQTSDLKLQSRLKHTRSQAGLQHAATSETEVSEQCNLSLLIRSVAGPPASSQKLGICPGALGKKKLGSALSSVCCLT